MNIANEIRKISLRSNKKMEATSNDIKKIRQV